MAHGNHLFVYLLVPVPRAPRAELYVSICIIAIYLFVWHLHFWLPALYIPISSMDMDMDMGRGVSRNVPWGQHLACPIPGFVSRGICYDNLQIWELCKKSTKNIYIHMPIYFIVGILGVPVVHYLAFLWHFRLSCQDKCQWECRSWNTQSPDLGYGSWSAFLCSTQADQLIKRSSAVEFLGLIAQWVQVIITSRRYRFIKPTLYIRSAADLIWRGGSLSRLPTWLWTFICDI